ncbi:MAG: Hpt domain-containing protein [Caulobacterales bacterium]
MTDGVQVIQPQRALRDKIGRVPAIDSGALARAEAALKSLSGQFQTWMEDEVFKLDEARNAARAAGWTEDALNDVFLRAHDAKGMGTTYEYPLVTRIAGSLCRFIETPEQRAVARNHVSIVEAHVDAIKAAVRGQIRTDDNPTGRVLAVELETRVADLTKGLEIL